MGQDQPDESPDIEERLTPRLEAITTLTFARVEPGEQEAQLITLTNSGASELQLKDIVLSPLTSTDFAVRFPDPRTPDDEQLDQSFWQPTLGPGESIPMRVIFTPASTRVSNAKIVISTNDPDTPLTEIALEGNTGPCLFLTGALREDDDPTGFTHQLNMGASPIGTPISKIITLENCSRTSDLNLSGVALTDDAGGRFRLDEGSLSGGEGVIEPFGSVSLNFTYEPNAAGVHMGALQIESDDPTSSSLRVGLSGEGLQSNCPVAQARARIEGNGAFVSNQIEAPLLSTIELDGTESSGSDGAVERYEWRLISAPASSTSRLTPGNQVASPRLFLDVLGEYEVELVVYDDLDIESCTSSRLLIKAVTDQGILVQVTWDTPADANKTDDSGADLDLYYRRAQGDWNDSDFTVFWESTDGDWGIPGDPTDNATLELEDNKGPGPEQVSHKNPDPTEIYGVGVHYYDDGGFGLSNAVVEIYLSGILHYQSMSTPLQDGVFWHAADIDWGSKTITPINTITMDIP